jgi:hypothetical protein
MHNLTLLWDERQVLQESQYVPVSVVFFFLHEGREGLVPIY